MYYPIEQVNLVENFELNSLEDLPKLKSIMEVMKLKANFSHIARVLGADRRTVKKYYNGYTKPTTRNKSSKIDEFIR